MTTTDSAALSILDFWFGPEDAPAYGHPRREWFRKQEAFDAEIRARFEPLYREALSGDPPPMANAPSSGTVRHVARRRQAAGEPCGAQLPLHLLSWLERPPSALALIILLDQFPRNMFRDSAETFAADRLALGAAQTAVRLGHDQSLLPVQRVFVYLPFEHSEDIACQRRSLELFESLAPYPELANTIEFARSHHDVVARFGRFPHRNRQLGRVNTSAEEEFLRQPGSRF